MNIATVLFVYNRPMHTERVLNAIRDNTEIPTKLYIFQDGIKPNESESEWNDVGRLIRNIQFTSIEIVIDTKNKGLAESIICGLDRVFEDYDAVIVLEDDCIPHREFFAYMRQCLEMYGEYEKIWQVTGYTWPLNLKSKEDVFFSGRMSSWGWGTWKDVWQKYCRDNDVINRINEDQNKSRSLQIWGSDLSSMLDDCILGRVDSWAVYFALLMIENSGLCVMPYKNLITNIGFDGSGTNCGNNLQNNNVSTNIDRSPKYVLPKDVIVQDEVKKAFADYYNHQTAVQEYSKNKKDILVYGIGNYFREHEGELLDKSNIIAFADRRKRGYYAGIEILKPRDIKGFKEDKPTIVIMLADIQECINVGRMLHVDLGVSSDRIKIQVNQYPFMDDNTVYMSYMDSGCKVSSLDEFYNAKEVFEQEIYNYYLNNKTDIVIDIGMNIGDATCFFLCKESVEKVYGFEPFQITYNRAKENLCYFLDNTDRLEIFSYGVSNVSEKRNITYNCSMSCAMSTLQDVSLNANDTYAKKGLINSSENFDEEIEVRRASEVILPICNAHRDNNIVLKIDCEGEEYEIIKDLSKTGILRRIAFIMMEWHYRDTSELLSTFRENGFSYWCMNKSKNMGLIYAINENIWK